MKKSITEKLVDIDLKRLKDNEEELKNLTNNMPKTNKDNIEEGLRDALRFPKDMDIMSTDMDGRGSMERAVEFVESLLNMKSREIEEEIRSFLTFSNESNQRMYDMALRRALKIIKKHLR